MAERDSTDGPPSQQAHPYERLTPELVLDAVEACGLAANGRILALNSYENRVYQIGIEDEPPVVVKFYRPGRWSDAAIGEEHAYTRALYEREVPAVPPLEIQGRTLLEFGGFRYAVFPSRGGRAPEFDDLDQLEWIGRYIGRIHSPELFHHRPRLTLQRYVEEPVAFLLERDFIPGYLEGEYGNVTAELTVRMKDAFEQAGGVQQVRLHGDCHPGNILWTEHGPHFVDFDDTLMGPPIQDLWMMISGSREEMALQLSVLLEGYETFQDFDRRQIRLIETLRTMRMIHYAAWLARRWDDPAFPMNFPWFNSEKYWEEHLISLQEQLGALLLEPLRV